MNRQDLKAKLNACIQLDQDLVTILCDYGLELQQVLQKLERAYEIVTDEEVRTNKYFLLRQLTEDVVLDLKEDIVRIIPELKRELKGTA